MAPLFNGMHICMLHSPTTCSRAEKFKQPCILVLQEEGQFTPFGAALRESQGAGGEAEAQEVAAIFDQCTEHFDCGCYEWMRYPTSLVHSIRSCQLGKFQLHMRSMCLARKSVYSMQACVSC